MKSTRPIADIEKKWQDAWERDGVYHADDAGEKFYGLIEFPFLSGDGLHVGHVRSYTAIDILTRKKRMEGKNVLYPIGWDAFGLPTENFAIKWKMKPADVTKKNIVTFKRQLQSLGIGFDWSREISTADSDYFKWTQWQFLQFVKAGLAYKAKTQINWCPKDKIGLANEEVIQGCCERCGTPVEKRDKEQWMIGITKYAERLINDLDHVDYLDKIKTQQINWIGKSEGATIEFGIQNSEFRIQIFTTRPDTLFGATYLVLAPEHPFVKEKNKEKNTEYGIQNTDQVDAYIAAAKKKTEMERTAEEKEKTGVELKGVMAIHPATGEQIPVWIADYVLANYGTGAIMAVPAHDERDFVFAERYKLGVRVVVRPETSPMPKSLPVSAELTAEALVRGSDVRSPPDKGESKRQSFDGGFPVAFDGDGVAVESDFLNGLSTVDAKQKTIAWLEKNNVGKRTTTYKLRDWVFSRQRYWGEPIPLVHCGNCAKKKQKVLIIHGFEGSAEGNWFPWMKTELEKRGFEVFVPTMTTSEHPVFEKWMEELTPFLAQMGEDDVIVGHSLGARSILPLLARAKKKIGHIILVAPAFLEENIDWERTKKKKEWEGSDVDTFRVFYDVPVSWEDVDQYAARKTVIFSDDDPYIPVLDHRTIPSGWFIQTFSGKEHFTDREYPELLEVVLQSKNFGWVPVPDDQLPVMLPDVPAYEPTDTGESPLANISEWVNTTCPRCGGAARRETDTMPNWAGSSWYFLRYCDSKNEKEFASAEKLKYWMPVDLYNGGMEHTTLHLLYSRFWHKFLWDMGYVPHEVGSEPYRARRSHGLILAQGGEKMSKSKGNVINPDDIVGQYGADVFRVYEMFMGPFDQPVPWDTNGIEGVKRFLDRVWALFDVGAHGMRPPTGSGRTPYAPTVELETLYHQTVRKITDGIERLQFNTCVSQLMILANGFQDVGGIPDEHRDGFLKLLAPFVPHLAEELWHANGHEDSIHRSSWPTFDASKLQAATFELVIQVNGKVRDKITVASDIDEEEAKQQALASSKVQTSLAGKSPKQIIYVKGKLVSIVV